MNKNATTKEQKSLKELHKEFLRAQRYAGGKRPKTLQNYQESFELLLKFKPDIKAKDLTEGTMIDFFEWLMTRKKQVGRKMIVRECKPSTINSIRRRLSVFFKWLKKHKHIKPSPFKYLPFAQNNESSGRSYTKEEWDKIYLAVGRDIHWPNQLLATRNMAMIMTLVSTGVRRAELLAIKLSDIDWKKRRILVRGETSKSKTNRFVPMTNELIPYLKTYLTCRSDYKTEILWVSGRGDRQFTTHGMKHLTEHLKKVTGIKDFRVHNFRHTFACNYYVQSNHDIIGLKKILGHKNIGTTIKVYLKSLLDEDMIKQMREFRTSKIQ